MQTRKNILVSLHCNESNNFLFVDTLICCVKFIFEKILQLIIWTNNNTNNIYFGILLHVVVKKENI